MSKRVLDASDIHTNTARFCDECRDMASFTTRIKDLKNLSSSEGLVSRQFKRPGLAKGSCFVHKQLSTYPDKTPTCELCIFLRVELGDGPDIPLPNSAIKAFAHPEDAAAQYVEVLQPPLDPSSDIVFTKAKEWISTCCASHIQCQVADRQGDSQLSLLPTRVIDVGPNDIDTDKPTIKIHLTTPNERGAYACRSYCWGSDQFKTTFSTLPSLTTAIPTVSLSRTITDAIHVVRRLGLRYLWVDALCTIQDSAPDIATEIARMGAIYKNATVTLAAATAPSAQHGFLHPPREPLRSAVVLLPLPDDRQTVAPVHFTLNAFLALGQARAAADHPLDTRGWCLQVYLLSPRVLVFSRWDVEWMCQKGEMEFVQGGPFGLDRKRGIEKAPVSASFRLPPGVFGQAGVGDLWEAVVKTEFGGHGGRRRLWERIVGDFTARALTLKTDRLPAVAGISGELERLWGDECLFGIFRRMLPWMLAWQVSEKGSRLEGAPSWSWASVTSPVSFYGNENPKLTDIKYDKDGGVRRLTVTSTLIGPSHRSGPLLKRKVEELLTWLDVDEPSDEADWSFLVIERHTRYPHTNTKKTTTRYLVLRPVEEGVYSRVGTAEHNHRGSMLKADSPWVKLSERPRTAGI